MFTLLPYFNLDQAQIFLFIRDYSPESVALLIEDTIGEILNSRNTGLLSIGALATVLVRFKRHECIDEGIEFIL